MNIIKFAILGFGHIGKRHFEEINSHPFGEVVAIVDIDNQKFDEKIGVDINFFSSLSQFFQSNIRVDIFCICTPNGLHFENAKEILEKGISIILEKPVCLFPNQGQELIQISEKWKAKIFPVLQNRFSPASVFIKNLLDNNKLGQIFKVSISCFWNRSQQYYLQSAWRGDMSLDGGTLFTQFSHFIDVMLWLLGDVEIIHKELRNFNHQKIIQFEDSGTVIFKLCKHQNSTLTLDYSTSVLNKNLESSLMILSENISLKIGGQYMNELVFFESNFPIEMPDFNSIPPNDYGFYSGSANLHYKVIENVISILNGNESNLPSMEEALKSIEIIRKIYD